jgi:4-diphosphocytidyl-2-C-methyl-D-erythritol kinase
VLYRLRDGRTSFVVLVQPPFGVSTKEAYGWWDAAHKDGPIVAGPDTLVAGERGNDLQGPVAARHAEVGRIAKRLAALGAHDAAMSGSGSAVFGLFTTKAAALAAAAALTTRGRRVVVTRTVGRAAFRRLSAIRYFG